MKSKLLRSSLLCFILLLLSFCCFTGCSRNPISSADSNEKFTNFTKKLFAQEVSANTINLHYTLQHPTAYGIKNPPVTFGTYNTSGALAAAGLENCLAALNTFPYSTLSSKNQLTFDILESHLETSLAGAGYTLYEEPLSPVTGIQAQLPVLLSEYQFHSASDADTYLTLLSDTPNHFDSLIAFEQKKLDAGLFLSPDTAAEIIEQCSAFISLDTNNYLYSTFAERIHNVAGISESEAAAYTAKNKEMVETKIIPAYQNLVDFLESVKDRGTNAGGLCNLPEGLSYYTCLVKRETGSSRTLSQLKELTTAQMRDDLSTIETILSTKDTPLDTSLSLTETNPSVILEDLKENMKPSFPAPPDVNAQVKYVPTEMEPYLSPAFYMIPAIDNTIENVIYINQAQMADGLELFTTLAHEGYPGHLYQTIYFADQNPDPIRSMINYGGYTEGWATYTEMCSYHMSSLPSDYADLLQRNASIMLGLYSLADIGIHAEGWSLLDTVSFFRSYGITDVTAIEQIYGYIVGDPGNYLKYYIGYLEFIELKKAAVKEWGDEFSQKRFHKAVLEVGPAPFDILRKEVLKK